MCGCHGEYSSSSDSSDQSQTDGRHNDDDRQTSRDYVLLNGQSDGIPMYHHFDVVEYGDSWSIWDKLLLQHQHNENRTENDTDGQVDRQTNISISCDEVSAPS